MNAHDIDEGRASDETDEVAAEEQAGQAGEAVAAEEAPAAEASEAATEADTDDGDASSEAGEAEEASEADGAAAAADENGEDDAPDFRQRDIDRVTALFTRSEGSVADLGGERFRFARWSRPIAPAIFGLSEESVAVLSAGFKDAAKLAGLEVAEQDEELGANILLYVVEDWPALREAPQLAELVPDLEKLTRLLAASGANQYRIFTFTPEGGLRLCIALLRYDEALAQLSAPSLALGQAVQTLLLWSDEAFAGESPVTVRRGGRALVKSRFARLLKAAYAAETPLYSEDPALAEQLVDRMRAGKGAGEDAESDQDAAREDGEADGGEAGSAGQGEDNSRRRRSRRRRTRSDEDKPREKASAAGDEEPFDPLGGDPRPLEDDAGEDGDGQEDETP